MKDFFRNLGILRPFFRGLPIIALIMTVAVMMARRYLRYTTPMYESTAKIKLADTREGIPNSNLFKDFDVFANSNKIAAEVELLKSKDLIGKAIAGLGIDITIYRVGDIHKTELYHQTPFFVKAALENEKLYDKPFVVVISADSLVQITVPGGEVVKGQLGQPIKCKGGMLWLLRNEELLKAKKNLPVNDNYEFICHSRDALIDHIIANMDVMSVDKEVPVLRISYKSAVPHKAAELVNSIAAAYIADYINEKYRSADTTVGFLSRQLSTMSQRLASSESDIEGYRNQNNIINIRQETETDLRKISDLKKQLASVQMNLLAIRDLNQRLATNAADYFDNQAPNFEAFTDLLSTELVKKMKELKREKMDLLVRYTPDNEKVKVIDAKMDDIVRYMRESIRNTERNLQIKYDDLNKTIVDAEEVFIGLPQKERTMTILERNFSLNEQIYRFLHEKRTEAEIARAATMSFHRIIAAGEVPKKPVSPNATLITVFAGFLGFLFGVFGVYAVHFLKARINEASIIQKNSDTPLLAEVPFLKKPLEQLQYFMRWGRELELKTLTDQHAVIALSSFQEGEGKQFIVHGLANALQRLGKTCVIIDPLGAGDPLAGVDSFYLSDFPANWIVQANWQQWLQQLRQRYDVVLIRNFPVEEDSSSLLLMANSTANLFVLDSRMTKSKMIMQADLLRTELGLPNMFFVLNRAQMRLRKVRS
ncbi:MAG: Wzz/FepE/Etk N-terminal domain-containing protein [Chitinophagaceae bacterium]|nr:Wzz/FepE/Etk N-terminal domain-containing protein [Chitinophagaceae bacterium]